MAKPIKRKSSGSKKKPYVQQDSHGALFKNTEKETDSHPDYKGTYTDENGEKFWVAAWVNESKSGKKYISFVTSSMEVDEDEEEEEEEEEEIPKRKAVKKGTKKSPDDLSF